jgi:hypothetical protein
VTFDEPFALMNSSPERSGRDPASDVTDSSGEREHMSMLRKTVLTVAIAGTGLGAMSGAAFANDSHHGDSHESHSSHGSSSHGSSSHGTCSNDVKALNETKGGGLADVAGGDQILAPINACDILNGNKLLNDNNLAIGGTITNGDTDGTTPTDGGLPGLGGIL